MTPSRITWDAAGARRLGRQFLANPAPPGTALADVVATMPAAHAQVLSAAELSVGLRTAEATRADVRDALWRDGTLIKTFGPRGTVHLLAARDLPFLTAALSAVPAGPNPFPPAAGLDDDQAARVVEAIGEALDGVCLTADELGEQVVARTGPWAGDLVMPAFQGMWPRWRTVLHRAGQSGALCFGPDRGRKVTYTRPPRFSPVPADDALRTLLHRYLLAYGPATSRHLAGWLAAPPAWTRSLFTAAEEAGEIEAVDFEDGRAWVAAGDTAFPDDPPRGVRLLPYFDGYGIAAQPRERLFPGPAYQRALARGQAGNYPVLLVDGVVAGVWHQRRRGRVTTVTVESLTALTARQERELAAQAERVGEVLQARAELVRGEVTTGPHA
ncbi:winged helix DNA-binding domain-containing protein [Streptomyces sp. NPDC058739]|uniref:winged helix DNA-binding domain-containing protein n=1 Tax=Streptomyces sp. NPDC058739 TaxID=3346618 RepID=UPI00369FF8E6